MAISITYFGSIFSNSVCCQLYGQNDGREFIPSLNQVETVFNDSTPPNVFVADTTANQLRHLSNDSIKHSLGSKTVFEKFTFDEYLPNTISLRQENQDDDTSKLECIKKEDLFKLNEFDIESRFISGLPIYFSDTDKKNNAEIIGHANLKLGWVPINIDYNYSTYTSPTGVNGYLKISLDQKGLKELFDQKKHAEVKKIESRLDSLHRKMSALKSEELKLNQSENLPEIPNLNTEHILPIDGLGNPIDSLDVSALDQLDILELDTILRVGNQLNKLDSLQLKKNDLSELRGSIDNIENEIELYQNRLDQLKSIGSKSDSLQKGEFFRSFLKSTKQFKIGLLNPTNGLYLVNGAPVNGVYLENELGHFYSAVLVGKTHDFSRGSSSVISNTAENTSPRNIGLFKSEFKSKVTLIQIGLIGEGRSMLKLGFLTFSNDSSVNPFDSENHVFSLDGSYIVSRQGRLFFSAATSSRAKSSPLLSEIDNLNGDDGKRNAINTGFELRLNKPKLEINGKFGYVQQNFKNPALYFLRADHLNYESDIRHSYSKKGSMRIFLIKSIDGQLTQASGATEFLRYGLESKQKVGKNVQIISTLSRLLASSFFYLGDSITSDESVELEDVKLNNSYHVSQSIFFNKRVNDVHFSFSSVISYYHMNQWGSVNKIGLVYVNSSFAYKRFTTSCSYSIQSDFSALESSEGERQQVEISSDLNYDKLGYSLGIGFVKQGMAKYQPGYQARVRYILSKSIETSLSYESIVPSGFTESIYPIRSNDSNYRIVVAIKMRLI